MTDIFDDPQNSEGQPKDQSTTGDLLGELVGEGKKFKTVEDLARSKVESDNFIEQLKREGAEMRQMLKDLESKVGKQQTIKEVLDAVKEARGSDDNQNVTTTEELLSLVDQRISARDSEKSKTLNYERAQSTLLAKFQNDAGKAREFVKSESQRLGMSPGELKALAQTSPEAFARILGLNQPKGSGQGPALRSDVNTESMSTSGGSLRNSAYYAELKQKLGAKFWDASIQQQRFKDAKALGTKFYE